MSAGGTYLLTLGLAESIFLMACAGPDASEMWGLDESRRFLPEPTQVATNVQRGDGSLTVGVPVGVGRDRFALLAREFVSVGRRAKLYASDSLRTSDFAIGSLGGIHVEADASVGPIYASSTSPVRLDDRVLVNGFVKAAGEVLRAPTANITAGMWEHASSGIEEFAWDLHPAPMVSEEKRSRSADAFATQLDPGAYASVVVEAGSVMRFAAGSYFIDSLRLERGGVLDLENAWGPIRIWTRRMLVLDGTLRDYFLGPNVFLGYLGDAPVQVNGPLRATLYAPSAEIILAKTEVDHGGAVFARAIRLQPGAKLEHRVLLPLPDINSPITLCQACLLNLRAAECCETTSPFDKANVANAAVCYSRCASGKPASEMRCISRCVQPEPGSTKSCAADLVQRLAECQLQSGYRPSMCLNLGYIRMEDVSCGG